MYTILTKEGTKKQRHCYHCNSKTSACCFQCSEIRYVHDVIMVCAKCQSYGLNNFGK